jgi:nitric oxide reductase large subunit
VPMYRKMLETHREVFKGVSEWLREGGLGCGGLLFHCTGSYFPLAFSLQL